MGVLSRGRLGCPDGNSGSCRKQWLIRVSGSREILCSPLSQEMVSLWTRKLDLGCRLGGKTALMGGCEVIRQKEEPRMTLGCWVQTGVLLMNERVLVEEGVYPEAYRRNQLFCIVS